MNVANPRLVEVKISRLTREIGEIDKFFYRVNEDEDRSLYAGMLERKRDDMVRSAVLQIHTAIEDVLNSQIICCILRVKPEDRSGKMRSKSARALRKMLFGAGSLGFDMKLNFAVALGLLNAKTKDKLMALNTLRNKCSHNWLLKAPVRHGRRPRQKKPPLLLYEGSDLHDVATLKDFAGEYGSIYYKLFVKYLS
jgi:hypothetical protein